MSSSPSSLLSTHKTSPTIGFDLQPDGKSLINPTEGATRSTLYDRFPEPIVNGDTTNGFDFHIVSLTTSAVVIQSELTLFGMWSTVLL